MAEEFEDRLTFPPIPVATGVLVDDPTEEAAVVMVADVHLRLTLEDGRQIDVKCEQARGAWWHPEHSPQRPR